MLSDLDCKNAHEQASVQQVLLTLSDLIHWQAAEIRRLKMPGPDSSIRAHIRYIFKKSLARITPRLSRNDSTRAAQSSPILKSLEQFHPGIKIGLKTESLWCRYVIATSRRLRGKSHPRYEAHIFINESTDPNQYIDLQSIVNSYNALMSRRPL